MEEKFTEQLRNAVKTHNVPDSLKYLKAARNMYSQDFEIKQKDVKLLKKLWGKHEYFIIRDLAITMILIP